MIQVIGPLTSGVAAGENGSATANSTSTIAINGKVLAVYVDYLDSPPATTDVTIATAGTNAPANTLLTLTDANTDGWFYPRHQVHDAAGAGVTYDGSNEIYEPVPIDDKVKITIAGANANDYVNVYLLLEK